jgi:hypothetical protein
VLGDSEIAQFWSAFDEAGLIAGTALKAILLTGQRPGEVAQMRREHIADGWWTMPGDPVPALDWPGTKNGASHRVWLPAPVQTLLAELDDESTGPVFPRGGQLDRKMRAVTGKLPHTPPHDLRRTWGTTCTGLGLGREAMDRVMNHKDKRKAGVTDIYDRHDYSAKSSTSWKPSPATSWRWSRAARPRIRWSYLTENSCAPAAAYIRLGRRPGLPLVLDLVGDSGDRLPRKFVDAGRNARSGISKVSSSAMRRTRPFLFRPSRPVHPNKDGPICRQIPNVPAVV